MSDNWLKAYSELKEFVASNPRIEIGGNVIAIPADVRPEFYRLFDKTRVAFLKEKCQTLLDEAAMLSSDYVPAAQEVKRSLGLSEIELPDRLDWFLNNPTNGLIRSLFDLLFDLLKGKIEINSFEHRGTSAIVSSFGQLFRAGYEKWVILSLVNLLAPDRALSVSVEAIQDKCHQLEPDQKTGTSEETVPDPEEMTLLSFGHGGAEPAFITSDIIVHSPRLNRYVAFGADLTDAMWTAKQVSDQREWCQLRELGKLYMPTVQNWPDLVVYTDNRPEDIALVADFGRFCRPDIIVECMEQSDWYQRGGLERVRHDHDFLKPRLGSYVVSRFPVPEEALGELTPQPAAGEPPAQTPLSGVTAGQSDIHIIAAGYEASRLNPIIEALSEAGSS